MAKAFSSSSGVSCLAFYVGRALTPGPRSRTKDVQSKIVDMGFVAVIVVVRVVVAAKIVGFAISKRAFH